MPGNSEIEARNSRVGRICQIWALLELAIDSEIWKLAGLRNTNIAACITNELQSIHTKLKVFTSICIVYGTSKVIIDRLNAFNGKIRGTSEKRNRAVHDAWFTTEGSVSPGQWNLARSKEDMAALTRPTSLNDLESLHDEIVRRYEEFDQICALIKSASSPLPETLPEQHRANRRD